MVRSYVLVVALAVTLLTGCGEEAPSSGADFSGGVTRIVDGDTFYMAGQDVRIRVWGLDAPERGDPEGPTATNAFSELIAGRTLSCDLIDTDRYGRPVARCFLPNGRDIAAAMIDAGVAEEYCRYSRGHYGQCG